MRSRSEAQEAIAAGLVTVDGAPALKPTSQVHAGQALVVSGPPRKYVSRGGHKLEGALDAFAIDPTGRHAIDAGVSTGGFTDCLLQRGVASVFAVDVGYGQVAERIRTDARVEVRERTNVRDLLPGDVPAPARDLVVADLSFISLRLVLPVLVALVAPDGNPELVLLVKPQFEAGKRDVGSGGVVREPQVWGRVLAEVSASAADLGWGRAQVVPSPITGPAGNVEFLLHLTRDAGGGLSQEQVDAAVSAGIAVAG